MTRTLTILLLLICVSCGRSPETTDDPSASTDSLQVDSTSASSDDPPNLSPEQVFSARVFAAADTLTAIHQRIENGTSVSCRKLLHALPGTFKAFSDLYGYREVGPASRTNGRVQLVNGPLFYDYQDHWSTFERYKNCFNQTSFIERFIAIASTGEWKPDFVTSFQVLMQRRLREQTEALCSVLQTVPRATQVGFWYFLMDGPHPGEKNPSWALDLVREPCPAQVKAIEHAAAKHASEGEST